MTPQRMTAVRMTDRIKVMFERHGRHTLIMRLAIGILALFILSSCSTPPAPDEPSYEEQVDALLKARPDDPDLLFLRLDRKDTRRAIRLAALRPTPLTLAVAVDELLADGVNEDNWREFENLLDAWIKCDERNAAPVVLKAQAAISKGELEAGTEQIIRASQLPVYRTYALEAQQEIWRLMRKEGLDDIALYGVVYARNLNNLSASFRGACSLLTVLANDHEYRGRSDLAYSCIEAECRLIRTYLQSEKGWLEASVAVERGHWASIRRCEMALMRRDFKTAEHAVDEARAFHVRAEELRKGMKRDQQDNPTLPAYREAGMIKEGLDSFESISTLLGASKEQWSLFWTALRKRESTIRPYVEDQIARGQAITLVDRLTDEDRQELSSLSFPVTQFWDDRKIFYSDEMTSERRERLLQWIKLSGTDADHEEGPEFMRERAFHSLLHSADASCLADLRKLLEDDVHGSGRISVILVFHGDRDPSLRERVVAWVDEMDAGAHWAAARLGAKEIIPDLVQTLTLDLWPDRLYLRVDEALMAYLALRDLAGVDLGFKSEPWEAWAEKTGNKKKD